MRNLKSRILVLTGAALAFVVGGCATVPYGQQIVEYEPAYCYDPFPPPPPVIYVTQPIVVVKRAPARHAKQEPAVTLHSREAPPTVTRTPARVEPRQPVITRPEPERRVPERKEPTRAQPPREERRVSPATAVDRNDDNPVAAQRTWGR